MKSGKRKRIRVICLIGLMLFFSMRGYTQSYEAQQLLLNYEKLVQLKQILENMYEGYQTLQSGYQKVKNVAEGNFKIHEVFLEELLDVSPQVKKYYRVKELLAIQQSISKEHLELFNRIKQGDEFEGGELRMMKDLLKGVFLSSIKSLDELVVLLADGQLRMSDFERIQAIDRLWVEMEGLLVAVRQINQEIHYLKWNRERASEIRFLFKDLLPLSNE